MADRSLIEGDEPLPRREEAPEWGYEEGVEWGLIFPDANGEYQSPINLNSREAKYDPSLLEVRLSPNYVVCRDCEVINDGHSIQIALKSKSEFCRFSIEQKFCTSSQLYCLHQEQNSLPKESGSVCRVRKVLEFCRGGSESDRKRCHHLRATMQLFNPTFLKGSL